MKVSAFQLYLSSLQSALTATGAQSSLVSELDSACAGLRAFGELDFGQFAEFLRQADEYRRSGAVTVPPQVSAEAENAHAGLRSITSLTDQLSGAAIDTQAFKANREKTRQELKQALGAFLKPLAIDVTLKDDRKEIESVLVRSRTRAIAAQVRQVLHGVTDLPTLNAPDRQDKLAAITGNLELADLKAIAVEVGGPKPGGKTKESVLASIVERLTGIKPPAKKAQRSGQAAQVDQAVVRQQAVNLKGLLEKSLDPDALSEAEVDGAVAELKLRSEAELRAIAQEADLENMGKKKADILKNIRLRLTEARRARESIQV